jgi:hypothetical protein
LGRHSLLGGLLLSRYHCIYGHPINKHDAECILEIQYLILADDNYELTISK